MKVKGVRRVEGGGRGIVREGAPETTFLDLWATEPKGATKKRTHGNR